MIFPEPLTRAQSRLVDEIAINEFGMPGVVLMENAGRNAAELIKLNHPIPETGIVICCGSGNNGGDGFVIARHLANANYAVKVILFAKENKIEGDARINVEILRKTHVPIMILHDNWSDDQLQSELAEVDHRPTKCIVDALLGTGATGPPRSPLDRAVPIMNAVKEVERVSIDIPTGLDCDTGKVADVCFKADRTLTFVAPKVGFEVEGVDVFLGALSVVDIGVPTEVLRRL